MTDAPWTGELPRSEISPLLKLGVLGLVVALLGALFAPERIAANALLWGFYLAGVGLAALLFVAINHVANASWATVFRRVPESIATLIPLGAALVLLTLLFAGPILYPWMSGKMHFGPFKELYLSIPFFAVRALLFAGLWIWFLHALRQSSLQQDANWSLHETRRSRRLSAAFLIVFGLTVSLASVDWIMSLEPRWFSTMFGVYQFAGMFVAGLAAITVFLIVLRRNGVFRDAIRESHLHDLGKLLFAFSTFWMYIWYSQFMLIWYSNLPEETGYYATRTEGAWGWLFYTNVVVNWVIPFLVLLPSRTKRHEGVLLRVALLLLFGHWLDLYVGIMPAVDPGKPLPGLWELASFAIVAAVCCRYVRRTFESAPPVPAADPLLAESLKAH